MGLLGFDIKMLEAFLVLPAFYVLYLVAAPVGWRRRMIHLGLATVVIVAASLPCPHSAPFCGFLSIFFSTRALWMIYLQKSGFDYHEC